MTRDDMERAMEFVLQQQVRFAEDLRQHQATLSANLDKFEGSLAKTETSFRRRIEFTVEQQAKFDQRQRRDEEKAADDYRRMRQLGLQLAKGYVQIQHAQQKREAELAELRAAQRKTDAQLAELAKAQKALAEAGAETERRLNAFIGALDRRFSGNGKGRK